MPPKKALFHFIAPHRSRANEPEVDIDSKGNEVIYRGTMDRFDYGDMEWMRILIGSRSSLLTVTPQRLATWLGVKVKSYDNHFRSVDDVVNPYVSDPRGITWACAWTFDLIRKWAYHTTPEGKRAIPMKRFRLTRKPCTKDEFPLIEHPKPERDPVELSFPAPYRQVDMFPSHRCLAFSGKMCRDYLILWRHVFEGQYNDIVVEKLLYGLLLTARRDFRIEDNSWQVRCPKRPQFRRVEPIDLPLWKQARPGSYFKAGPSWFALARDAKIGMRIIREQAKEDGVYFVITLQYMIPCFFKGGDLSWSEPKPIGHEDALSALIWATTSTPPTNTRLHTLPVDIQNQILHEIREYDVFEPSHISAASLGCDLELGLPMQWGRQQSRNIAEHNLMLWRSARTDWTPVDTELVFVDNSREFPLTIGSGLHYRPRLIKVPPNTEQTWLAVTDTRYGYYASNESDEEDEGDDGSHVDPIDFVLDRLGENWEEELSNSDDFMTCWPTTDGAEEIPGPNSSDDELDREH